MNINVTISLGPEEYASDLSGNATEIAEKILEAVGGDPEKDVVSVAINDSGTAGAVPVIPVVPPYEQIPHPDNTLPPVEPVETPDPVVVNSTFATNNSAPPGDKQTRTNATSLPSVTSIYVDKESSEGDDISAGLLALVMGDNVEIRGVNDDTRYGLYVLSSTAIDQGDFIELLVSFVEAGNPLTNGACTLKFADRKV